MSRKSQTSKQTASADGSGRIRRILSGVRNMLGRKTAGKTPVSGLIEPAPARTDQAGGQPASRGVRRQSDIPMDLISGTYTPAGTSSKTGFRSDGADHQSDQEFAAGMADERWKDEDRFTNKSGDPRIGTRGRTYEPGENRDESRTR